MYFHQESGMQFSFCVAVCLSDFISRLMLVG